MDASPTPATRSEEPPEIVMLDDICVEITNKKVRVGDMYIHLRPRELQLLIILCLSHYVRKGEPVSEYFILRVLFPEGELPGSKAIEVHMCNLRKRLSNASGGKNYIRSMWGRGYYICVSK